MRLLILVLATASALLSFDLSAQDTRGIAFQDCRSGTPRRIVEIGSQVALNDFGPTRQTILGGSGTLGLCITGSPIRWRLEGNYVNVSENVYDAHGALVGVGFTARPIKELPRLTVTPMGRLGAEESSVGRSDLLYGGSVTIEYVVPIRSQIDTSGPSVQLILVERPEFLVRSVVRSSVPIETGSGYTFTNVSSAGLDGSFGTTSRWRWKASIALTSIAEDVSTNRIVSWIVAFRPTSGRGASYPWSIELWRSYGNGRYRGTLVSFTLRFD